MGCGCVFDVDLGEVLLVLGVLVVYVFGYGLKLL